MNTLHYSPPPATVPIEHLGQYLYEQRLVVVRSFFTARSEFIVEVVDKPPIEDIIGNGGGRPHQPRDLSTPIPAGYVTDREM